MKDKTGTKRHNILEKLACAIHFVGARFSIIFHSLLRLVKRVSWIYEPYLIVEYHWNRPWWKLKHCLLLMVLILVSTCMNLLTLIHSM